MNKGTTRRRLNVCNRHVYVFILTVTWINQNGRDERALSALFLALHSPTNYERYKKR